MKLRKKPQNKQKPSPFLMNEKILYRFQKLSQLPWEQHITEITEEIFWFVSISSDLKSD